MKTITKFWIIFKNTVDDDQLTIGKVTKCEVAEVGVEVVATCEVVEVGVEEVDTCEVVEVGVEIVDEKWSS